MSVDDSDLSSIGRPYECSGSAMDIYMYMSVGAQRSQL